MIRSRPLVVGLAGGTGSGKTTVALDVHSRYVKSRLAHAERDDR